MEGVKRGKVRLLPHNESWAKPILDVAVIVKSFASMDINALTSLGYEDCGREAPDYNRWLFVMRSKDDLSLRHIH